VINTNGAVIAINDQGMAYAVTFDEFTGQSALVWQSDTGIIGAPRGSPAIVGGKVLIPLLNAEILVLDEFKGTIVNTLNFAALTPPLQGEVGDMVVPLITGDIDAALTTVGSTLVLMMWPDAKTPANVVWRYKIPGNAVEGFSIAQASGAPAVAVVIGGDGNLYGVSVTDGTPMWTYTTGSTGVFSEDPAISRDGTLTFIAVEGQGIVAVKTATGKKAWSAPLDDPAPSGSIVIGQDGALLVGGKDSNFYSYSPVDGSKNWVFGMANPVINQAVVDAGGYIYVSDNQGILYCIDSVTGTQVWQLPATGVAMAGMAIDDDHDLYVVTSAGDIRRVTGVEPIPSRPGPRIISSAQWSQQGGNAQHAGQSQYNFPAPPSGYKLGTVWQTQTGGELFCGAVADKDGHLYVPDDHGKVYSLDGATGAIRWEFPLQNGFVNGEVAISPDSSRVYVGGTNGYLYALDSGTGDVVWRKIVSGPIESAITVSTNDHVLFACADKFVYGFTGPTGVQFLKVPSGSKEDAFAPAMLYDDMSTVFGSEDGFIRAYDSKGNQLWRYQTHGPVMDVPCVSPIDGTVYAGALLEIAAIEQRFGDRIWLQGGDNLSGASPGCGGKHHLLYIGSSDGRVHALDESTGEDRWVFQTQDRVYSNPVLSSDSSTLFITSTDGNLYALDAATGGLMWSYAAAPLLRGDPVLLRDGTVVVTSMGTDAVVKIGYVPINPPSPPVPGGMSPGGAAALSIFIIGCVGAIGYVGGGYGMTYYRTGKWEHPHRAAWGTRCEACSRSVRHCCGSVQDTVLRRNVPSGYSSSGAALTSSSAVAGSGSGYGSGPATVPKAGSSTGGYGSL
jgi:outer membrane protein assembly factor BamB